MSSDRVAIFIDFENLVYGVENNDPSATGEPPLDVDIDRIVAFARDQGRLTLARAYADWRNSSVRQHQPQLYAQGIETVHVFGRRHDYEVKNAVDVALAVDAVRSLFEREYDIFILISGDRDFLPLLRAVREHGRQIIGVSVRESASRDLPNLCDRFVYYRDLLSIGRAARGERATTTGGDIASFKAQLRQLLADEVPRGGVLGATLKPMIRNRIDPGFDELQYGYTKFSRLLESMPDIARVTYTDSEHGGDIRVFPVDGGDALTSSPGLEPRPSAAASETSSSRPDPIISRPSGAWEPTPEAFLTRARARLARTGLHLDRAPRDDMMAAIYGALPTGDEYRSQTELLTALDGQQSPAGHELEHSTLRRYLWALYQSWVFDIDPPDRNKDHLERGLQLKPEYRDLDAVTLRLEQSLLYKVYELLPDELDDKIARIRDLFETDEPRAATLLERVEAYRREQQQRRTSR